MVWMGEAIMEIEGIEYVFVPDSGLHRCSRCDLPFDDMECHPCDCTERSDGETGVWKRASK